MSVQKLRLKAGWSQQQLATASGLSSRTIQRIEAGQPASVETLKSIAAVFQVDFNSLEQEQNMNPSDNNSDLRAEAAAFRQVRKLRSFYIHLLIYITVCLSLLAVNLITTPHNLWVVWVIGGWGLGVLLSGFSALRPDTLFGPQWERRQVEKILGRPL